MLRKELQGQKARFTDKQLESLSYQLGGLPLALHLAAGFLRRPGRTIDSFLRELTQGGLTLRPFGANDPRINQNEARTILNSSFEISWRIFVDQCGMIQDDWPDALASLGFGPPCGFGLHLGCAGTTLHETAFQSMIHLASDLSIVRTAECHYRIISCWIHPLLASFLRRQARNNDAANRFRQWFQAVDASNTVRQAEVNALLQFTSNEGLPLTESTVEKEWVEFSQVLTGRNIE